MSASSNLDGLKPVKSTLRTLEVLEYLATSSEKKTLGELSRTLGIPKSSLQAILRTMYEKGWLETDARGTGFGIGVRALQVGTSYVDTDDVASLAADGLDRLVRGTNETAHLGRLDGADVIYLAKRESTHALRMFSAIGRRLPAYATALGKAILAELPGEMLSEHLPSPLVPLTKNTITDRDQLAQELQTIRGRGYAIDREENSEGICCVAVTLPTREPSLDALSCSVPVVRFQEDRVDEIVGHLMASRNDITRKIPRSPYHHSGSGLGTWSASENSRG